MHTKPVELYHIIDDIDTFVGNQEQNDDITMLLVQVKDNDVLHLTGTLEEFDKIKTVIFESDIGEELKLQLCLAAEEIYANICSYAFSSSSSRKVDFKFLVSDKVVMVFKDNGIPYNPLEDVKILENEEGGLGKYIAFTIADIVNYENIDDYNVLTLIKNRGVEL